MAEWIKNENGSFSYLKDGERVVDCMIRSNNKAFYVNSEGVLHLGWYTDSQNRTFYFDRDAGMLTGIQHIDNQVCYFAASDYAAKNILTGQLVDCYKIK